MSSRTTITLTVLSIHAHFVQEFDEVREQSDKTIFSYFDCSQTDISWLLSDVELRAFDEHHVPYDLSDDGFDDAPASTISVRYQNGEKVVRENLERDCVIGIDVLSEALEVGTLEALVRERAAAVYVPELTANSS